MDYLSHLLLLVVAYMLIVPARVQGQIQYSHRELPKLYNFDDYDACFETGNSKLSTTYCMVYAEIKPNNDSELWQKIEAHSAHKFHFRHDRLFFGMCLERCMQFLPLANETNALGVDDIVNNEITQFFETVHKRPLDIEMRSKYAAMIHNCVNEEFERKYKLNLRTFVEYCEGREVDNPMDEDPVESFLYKILQVILLLVILSSLYDYSLKTKQPKENQTNDFYKIYLEQPKLRLLSSFSIVRNYYRLFQPYRGDLAKEFSYLDGFRTVCTVFVVFAHIFFLQFMHVDNSEYFEQVAHSFHGLMFLSTFVGIEVFMVMSGMFLYIKFTEGRYITQQTNWKECIRIYGMMLLYRLLRFLPSVGFMLIGATAVVRFSDGPFWRHHTEPSRVFSRENWWKNVLMINNYSQKDTMGPHTWYIAAEFQLFLFYALVLIFIAKYPQYKKHILITLGALAVAIPTVISYIMKLESSFVLKPESYRYSFFYDIDVFYYLYTPAFTNLGGYLFGIWCGDLYLTYIRNGELRQKLRGIRKYELGIWLSVPIAVCISIVGKIMIFKEPSIWTALYAGLNRNLWIVFVCGFPLLGMACKLGKSAYEFCCLPIFRVLAPLSFQVYMWHLFIMQLLNGDLRKPLFLSRFIYNGQAIVVTFLTGTFAILVCLFIEYPFVQCLHALQLGNAKEQPKEKKVQ